MAMGSDIKVKAKIIDVETGENIGSRSVECKNFSYRYLSELIDTIAPTFAKCK